METLITVIVPVYNVEKYLEKCVDSILNQTYKNLEVVLVDDGSTDNSGNLCEDIKKRDGRIKVIHKENGGLSDARNYGINAARGKYIGFIDSDDYIEPDMFESLMRNMIENDADISVCAYDMVYPDKVDIIAEDTGVQVYTTDEAFKVLLHRNNIGVIACNKLINIELLQEVRFPLGRHFEDINTTYKIIDKANKVVYDPRPLYHYIQRVDSINGVNFKKKQFNQKLYDMVSATDELYEFVKLNKSSAIDDISVGCLDYYVRVINQEIIYNIKNNDLIRKAKQIGKNQLFTIIGADYLATKKKMQLSLFLVCFPIYKAMIKILK